MMKLSKAGATWCRATVGLLLCAAQASAQTEYRALRAGDRAGALGSPVTVNAVNVPLQDVLQDLAKQAGLGLGYRHDLKGLSQRVTLQARDMRAAEAVVGLLRGTGLQAWVSQNGQTLTLRETPQTTGRGALAIRGVVRDAESSAPVIGAEVRLLGAGRSVISGSDGGFVLQPVTEGTHEIEAVSLGYAASRAQATVSAEGSPVVELRLSAVAVRLSDVVVTPGHFGIAQESANRPQTLTRDQIETLPQLAEDIYRTVNRLPGIGSMELSAKFGVRGSRDQDLLVLLDGLELVEPYHLKDFDGSLSIIDVAAIGGVDLTTGGFSAEHGNRLVGIFDLKTTSRITPRPRTTVGLSISNLRLLSQGSFGDGKGLWLLSGRRGYLDILLKMSGRGDNLEPSYSDVLGKLIYQLTPDHRLGLRVLRADDTAHFLDDDGNGTLDSSYGSTYAWLTWNARLSERLEVITLASSSLHEWNRGAEENDGGGFFEVRDTRDLQLAALKQDWLLNWSERLLLRWGGELKGGSADYDYFRMMRRNTVENNEFITRLDSSTVSAAPEGSELGLYLSQRMRPWQPLTIETGLRWDRQTLTGQSQLSPRVSALLALDARTNLRAAWGRYAQPQALHQLRVVDGESSFSGAEQAEQLVVGVERDLGQGLRARAEVYRRLEWDLQPRYRNLNNTVEPVAEVEGDRVRIEPRRARARGVELMVLRNRGRSSWSASYALARAEDRIDQAWVPRPLDQRHTFYTDYSIAPGANWRLSWAWQYHTGWPSTPVNFAADTVSNGDVIILASHDAYNSGRFPSYHRMDLRVTRAFDLKRGRLSVFLDVFNLYDRNNPLAYDYSVNYSRANGVLRVNRLIEPLLPRLPTIGATWEF